MNTLGNKDSGKRPEIVGVGWLSDDKTYVKLKINTGIMPYQDYLDSGILELIMKKSKLTEKKSGHEADYLLYLKPQMRKSEIDF